MEPATALLLASAASSAAGMYNNQRNIQYAGKVNQESVELANTAHQREVRDLEAAGLNPVLSAQSSGAAVPSLTTPNLEGIDGAIGHNASSLARAMSGQMKSEAQIAASEASSAYWQSKMQQNEKELNDLETELEKARVAAELTALEGPVVHMDDAFKYKSSNWWKLVDSEEKKFDAIKAAVERGRYQNSRGHAIFEDAINTASALMGVSSEARGWSDSMYERRHPFSRQYLKYGGR